MDSLEFIKTLPDKSIDYIISDPPYGIGESKGKNKSRSKLAIARDYGNKDWDSNRIDKEFIDDILRISKYQIIFGGNYYADLLPASSCWIVWDKNNGNNDFADCELAWTSFNTAIRKFKYTWNGMLQEYMGAKEKRYHPTQKPLPLMKWIIERYTTTESIIFDPFMGSGTTLVAAKELGRKYIGIDIDPEYVDITNKRLEQESFSL